MAIRFTDWRGSSNASPIANKLAEQAGVQQAPQTLSDYKAQQELSNVAQARMGANTPYQTPEQGKFTPNSNLTSISMAPSFETKAQAQQRADEADTRAYQQAHPGLSNDFSAKIADILRQGRQAEQMYRDRADGNLPKKTMGEIAQERMASIPQEQSWRRQNPFSKEMGYEWAGDDKLKGLGWGDDDITSMKARTEFDPQEIQSLYRMGALRAPYAEYLKEQERLRQEAQTAAAQSYASQSYDNDYGYDGGYESEATSSTESDIPYYGDNGFSAYDNASLKSQPKQANPNLVPYGKLMVDTSMPSWLTNLGSWAPKYDPDVYGEA